MATQKRPRLGTGLCYYVNIDYPFVCTTMDKAEDKLEQYKGINVNIEAAQGMWKAARLVEPVYYYQFSTSRTADKSTSMDFIVLNNPIDTDKILPRAQRGYVAIQLELYTKSQLQDHCKKSILSVVQGLLAQSTPDQIGQVLLQLQKELKDTAQGATHVPNFSLPPYPKPYNYYPGNALNIIFKNAITEFCEQNGYKVYSDQSRIIESSNPQASRYFAARPDLVLYNPRKLHGVVCVLTEEEKGEQETEPEPALIGAISENKLIDARDALGQLLGGMEKIAGDLAYEYIRSVNFQRFNKIQLTGLVMDYRKDECEVHELTIDFEKNWSILRTGQQKLRISDAANRLILKLESAQRK